MRAAAGDPTAVDTFIFAHTNARSFIGHAEPLTTVTGVAAVCPATEFTAPLVECARYAVCGDATMSV
jgi:hypothetical protein